MNRKLAFAVPRASTLISLALAGLAVCFAAGAQEKLEEVTVFGKNFVPAVNSSGTKTDTPPLETPQSLSVISRDLLDSWNTGKLTEALRYTPGVNAEPFGIEPRFTSVRMRGFTAASEGIFRDGLVLANPRFIVSYNLEPYGAERIEVPRGPASVLYGQGSPGGLVNYVSKLPKTEAFGELAVEAGNYDRRQGQFDVGTPLNQAETVTFRATGLYRESDTQIDFVPEDREYLASSLRWQLRDRTSLTFLASYQQDDTMNSQALPANGTLTANPNGTIPISRFTGEPTVDTYDRTEFSAGYQFEHRFSDAVRFFQNARFNDVDLDDIVVFSNGLRPDLRTITRSAFGNFGELRGTTIDNQVHFAATWGAVQHKVLAGVDYLDVNARSVQHFGAAPTLDIFNPVYGVGITLPAPFVNSDVELHQYGVYLQDEIKLNERFIVNLAVRYDDSGSETFSFLTNRIIQEQDDSELTFRAGLLYLTGNGFAPYVSYAESFLPSTGVDTAGNPFEPEHGRQYEIGLKYEPPGVNGLFTLALFDLERQDFVARDNNFILFQTGRATSRGVELEAFAAADNGLSIIANYSYLDTQFDENANPALIGKEFTQIPDHKGSVWLDYNFRGTALANLGVGLGVRYQSATFSDALNTIESPSFTLIDAAIHYEWQNMRFGLNAQNVTDKEFQSSCFTRNSVLCTFGEARTVRGTIKYRW